MPSPRKPADLARDIADAKREALRAAERVELFLDDLRKKPPAPSVKRRLARYPDRQAASKNR